MMCALSRPAMGQAAPAQGQVASAQPQQPSNGPFQIRPESLEHLYWHFLVFQNHLDTKAADLDTHGKDGSGLRNLLQKKTGLSDAEFAHIRTSSVRLTAKVKELDAQAVAIRASGHSSTSYNQLHALTIQRETNINAEIAYLKQNLPPDRIKAFEAFLTQFFSPNNAVHRPPSSTGQPAPAAVQK
jgi:hypothetical protein